MQEISLLEMNGLLPSAQSVISFLIESQTEEAIKRSPGRAGLNSTGLGLHSWLKEQKLLFFWLPSHMSHQSLLCLLMITA
jgi:hypothetical protein